MKTGRFSAAGETYISSSLDSFRYLIQRHGSMGRRQLFSQKKRSWHPASWKLGTTRGRDLMGFIPCHRSIDVHVSGSSE